jgi:hypothetical protein
LPWCWYWWFFIILKKLLYIELSCDERHLQPRKSLFFSLQESSAKKSFCLRVMKNRQHQHKGKPHRQEKLRKLQFLWKRQLQIQYMCLTGECGPSRPLQLAGVKNLKTLWIYVNNYHCFDFKCRM